MFIENPSIYVVNNTPPLGKNKLLNEMLTAFFIEIKIAQKFIVASSTTCQSTVRIGTHNELLDY